MLVLDVTEDLLYDILQRDEPRGTAQLVNDDGDALLALHQELHQRAGLHALRDEDRRDDALLPRPWAEHLAGVDVAHDVVDIIAVDDELGEARGDEEPLEMLAGGIELGTDDLIARQETVAHLQLGKANGVLDDLDLGLYARGLSVIRAVRQVVLEIQ